MVQLIMRDTASCTEPVSQDDDWNYGKPMPKVTPEPKPAVGLGTVPPGLGADSASNVSAPLINVTAVRREGSAPLVLETIMTSPGLSCATVISGKRSSISCMLGIATPRGGPVAAPALAWLFGCA